MDSGQDTAVVDSSAGSSLLELLGAHYRELHRAEAADLARLMLRLDPDLFDLCRGRIAQPLPDGARVSIPSLHSLRRQLQRHRQSPASPSGGTRPKRAPSHERGTLPTRLLMAARERCGYKELTEHACHEIGTLTVKTAGVDEVRALVRATAVSLREGFAPTSPGALPSGDHTSPCIQAAIDGMAAALSEWLIEFARQVLVTDAHYCARLVRITGNDESLLGRIQALGDHKAPQRCLLFQRTPADQQETITELRALYRRLRAIASTAAAPQPPRSFILVAGEVLGDTAPWARAVVKDVLEAAPPELPEHELITLVKRRRSAPDDFADLLAILWEAERVQRPAAPNTIWTIAATLTAPTAGEPDLFTSLERLISLQRAARSRPRGTSSVASTALIDERALLAGRNLLLVNARRREAVLRALLSLTMRYDHRHRVALFALFLQEHGLRLSLLSDEEIAAAVAVTVAQHHPEKTYVAP